MKSTLAAWHIQRYTPATFMIALCSSAIERRIHTAMRTLLRSSECIPLGPIRAQYNAAEGSVPLLEMPIYPLTYCF